MDAPQHTQLPPLPDGWFAVCWSKDLRVGEVKNVHYFEQDLALFRGRSGAAKVIDPYCPHMGAHLGVGGTVVGETIACPYHGWRYDGNGQCVEIPYCDEVPARAKLKGWQVTECNEMVFVWRHARGEPPQWQVPVIAAFSDPDWSEPRLVEFETPVCIQDMAENQCDPVHFKYVHKQLTVPESEVTIAADGRCMHMEAKVDNALAQQTGMDIKLVTDAYGLGMVTVQMTGIPDAGLMMMLSSTPITNGTTITRWVMSATNNMIDLVGEEFIRGLVDGVKDDYPIWDHKIHRPKPVLCKADTSLATFRKWVQQFYSEAA